MIIRIKTNEPAEYTYVKAVNLFTSGAQATILYLSGGITLTEVIFDIGIITKFEVWSNEN